MLSIFRSSNGELSYKRVSGFIALIVAIILAFLNKPNDLVVMFLYYAGSMGAGGLFEKGNIKGLTK